MNAHLRSIYLFALLSLMLITQIGASCMSTDTSRNDRDDLDSSAAIPRDARKVGEGAGRLTYTARSAGRIYLWDLDDRTVIDNREIRRDQLYTVMPDQNRIEVDGRTVSKDDLKRRHNHRLYFRASDSRDDGDDRDTLSTDRLPRNAKSVANGTGELRYKVRDRGRVFIYDAETERVLMSRDVYPDQVVEVDPERDRVLIDGKKVFDRNLDRKHAHRIYFEKE
jgi:hypothetical protein